MLAVDEALQLMLQEVRPLAVAERPLIDCLGCLLAEDIAADGDQPPFDKSLVDGYAVRSADLANGGIRLQVGETILAGQTPGRALGPREAAVIMTGAPLPQEADAVVMLEHTSTMGQEIAVDAVEVRAGQNILRRGRVYGRGDLLLRIGAPLSPTSLGLLASVGHNRAQVIPRPTVAILPTGDELVDPRQVPGPGQIRNSNAVMLEALAVNHRAIPEVMPIVADDSTLLRELVRKCLAHDVLLLTGGVSAGQRDLVPGVLEQTQVRRVFHKVRMKPGKPLWFGLGPGRQDRQGTLVFGLPGNPASALVGFLVFVAPALEALAGMSVARPANVDARLAFEFLHRSDRTTYWPARWVERPGERGHGGPGLIETLDWAGSADVAGMARADGFAVLDAGSRLFQAGEIVPFLPLR